MESDSGQQVADVQFSSEPLGHSFLPRRILGKVNARKCVECGQDVFEHTRSEVDERDMMLVMDATADGSVSVICEGELAVGSFKAMIAELHRNPKAVAVNCAGTKLHRFLPKTRAPADALREQGRLYDCEWEDSEHYAIAQCDLFSALSWSRDKVQQGHLVVSNCAQGKSRSGTFATAYLMQRDDLSVSEALGRIQSKRPLVQPNPGFLRQLRAMETALRERH